MCNFLTLIEILMSYNEILLHYGFFLKKRQIVSKINLLVLVFFIPLANVSMIWEIYHRRWSVANIVLCLVLIALCDTGHVSYHHNQPLWILWFIFLTKLTLFRFYVYQVAQHQGFTERVVRYNVLRIVRRADVTS